MKMKKKEKTILPEVHILGDLEDVINLISGFTLNPQQINKRQV